METHHLGRISVTNDSGPGPKTHEMSLGIQLTSDEWERYLEAHKAVQSLEMRATYMLLVENYTELKNLYSFYVGPKIPRGARTPIGGGSSSKLTRAFTNWLTSTRLYLESGRDGLARRFGKGSPEANLFRAATNRAYDRSTTYGFLYKLRDYAQHVGPPTSTLQTHRNAEGDREVVVGVEREVLLSSNFNWGSPVRRTIQSYPETISLMPLVDEVMRDFNDLELTMLGILVDHCRDAIPVLREAVERVPPADGATALIVFKPPAAGSLQGPTISQWFLPTLDGLNRLEVIVDSDDLFAILTEAEPPPEVPGVFNETTSRAWSPIRTWTAGGLVDDIDACIRSIVQQDNSPIPLLTGMFEVNRLLINMYAMGTGTSTEALVGWLSQPVE